jgi:hypothetical protein
MENDKRKRERFAINHIIELSTSDGLVVNSQGVNVSESGLLCRTDVNIPPGTFVLFQLPVIGGKPGTTVPCEGIVLRSGKDNSVSDEKYNVVINFCD